MIYMQLIAIYYEQVPQIRQKMIDTMMKYFHTDSVFVRHEPGSPLALRQTEIWDPIVSWLENELQSPVLVTDSIFGTQQPKGTVEKVRTYLEVRTPLVPRTCRLHHQNIFCTEGH